MGVQASLPSARFGWRLQPPFSGSSRLSARSRRSRGETHYLAARGFFHGTSACLSALYRAERYQQIVDLLGGDEIWPYKRWAVKGLAAIGRKSEAMRYAESCRGPWTNDNDVNRLCEEILLSAGLVDEGYRRYGLVANRSWWRSRVREMYAVSRGASPRL